MYYFSFVYLFVLVLLGKKLNDRVRFALVLLPFIMIVFLRFGIGADYFSYESIYYRIDPNNISQSFASLTNIELFYKILNLAAIKIGIGYHLFVGVIASSLVILTLKWLYDNSSNFELSALLHYSFLFIYWNLSALRQGIVITILLYIYFNNKRQFSNKFKIVSTVLLFFVHASSIIVPVIYVVSLYKWNKRSLMILFLLAPFVRMLFNPN